MLTILTVTLDEFVQRYPPRPPRKAPDNEGQLRLLRAQDGVFEVARPVQPQVARGIPGQNAAQGRHLWVFVPSRIPAIVEVASVTPPLDGLVKHTNLTGGADASSGGELWFDASEPHKLYVNGASGRYGPQSPQALEDAVSVFQAGGFDVVSVGWDDEVDLPARVLR